MVSNEAKNMILTATSIFFPPILSVIWKRPSPISIGIIIFLSMMIPTATTDPFGSLPASAYAMYLIWDT